MSPASSAANFYDNQNQSLFGDPVPPATDFLETLDNHLYGSLRRNPNVYNNNNNNNVIGNQHTNNNHISRIQQSGHNSKYRMASNASVLSQDLGYPESLGQPSPLSIGVASDHRNRIRLGHLPLPTAAVYNDPFQRDVYYHGLNRPTSSDFSDEFRSNLDSNR